MKSEGEEVNPSLKQTQDKETGAAAQTEDDLSLVVKLKRVHPTSSGVDTPQQGHQYVTDKETRTAATALELLQETEDPTATDGTQTPPGEAAHFEGTGLMDNIRNSLKKKKGTHSHWTLQQVTVDTPASSITAVPIQHVPWAKVIAEDLINLQLRLGSPNTLVMAASESTSSCGRGGRSGKREPRPPSESRALADITGSTGSGSGVAARKDGEEADNLELGISQLIILSWAISGQATQTRCLMTIHLTNKDTLPLLYTLVLLHILCISDSLLQAYFYLKKRRLVKDMMNFITSMLSDPYPNQRLIQSGAVCTSCHWF